MSCWQTMCAWHGRGATSQVPSKSRHTGALALLRVVGAALHQHCIPAEEASAPPTGPWRKHTTTPSAHTASSSHFPNSHFPLAHISP